MSSKHDEKARQMSLKPHLIGLDKIVLTTGEAHILAGNGDLQGEPDGLAFDPSTGTLYNIEYKCNNTGSQEKKAHYQLKRNGVILQSMFGAWNVVNLYVHGDYKVERI